MGGGTFVIQALYHKIIHEIITHKYYNSNKSFVKYFEK